MKNLTCNNISIRNKIDNFVIDGIKLDGAKLDILCYTIPFIQSSPVEVRPSPIHGNGVFATRNINAGEFLTFYPGDALIYKPSGKDIIGHFGPRKGFVPAGLDIPSNISSYFRYYSSRYIRAFGSAKQDLESNIKNGYWYDIDDNYSIYGDPSFTDNQWYIGHIINDAINIGNSNINHCRKYNSYFRNLGAGLGVAVIAKENIKKDQEVLISYGNEYWGL